MHWIISWWFGWKCFYFISFHFFHHFIFILCFQLCSFPVGPNRTVHRRICSHWNETQNSICTETKPVRKHKVLFHSHTHARIHMHKDAHACSRAHTHSSINCEWFYWKTSKLYSSKRFQSGRHHSSIVKWITSRAFVSFCDWSSMGEPENCSSKESLSPHTKRGQNVAALIESAI